MTEYNRTQTDYRERCKSRIQRQLEISKLINHIEDSSLWVIFQREEQQQMKNLKTCWNKEIQQFSHRCNNSKIMSIVVEVSIYICKTKTVEIRVGPKWVQPIPIPIYSPRRYFCQYRYQYFSTNISATGSNTYIFILAYI